MEIHKIITGILVIVSIILIILIFTKKSPSPASNPPATSLKLNNGSLSAPSLSFANDSTTGVFLDQAPHPNIPNVLGISASGFGYAFGNGYFCPGATHQANLGLGTNEWIAVYAQNGVIQTSDKNYKKDIEDIPLGLDFVKKLKPRKYKWVDGKSGRYHYGLIAQELKDLLDTENIDTKEFAGYVDSAITESPEKPSIKSINYSELVPILIKAIQELNYKLDRNSY